MLAHTLQPAEKLYDFHIVDVVKLFFFTVLDGKRNVKKNVSKAHFCVVDCKLMDERMGGKSLINMLFTSAAQ